MKIGEEVRQYRRGSCVCLQCEVVFPRLEIVGGCSDKRSGEIRLTV